jgi:hypothetical protein
VFLLGFKPARAPFCNPFLGGAICMDLASTVEINPVKGSRGYGV